MKTKYKLYLVLFVLVVLLGFIGIRAYLYARQPDYKTFKSNVTFQYPKSWNVQNKCNDSKHFINTKTVVNGDYAGKKAELTLIADVSNEHKCHNGKLIFDLEDSHNTQPYVCDKDMSSRRLSNGIHITSYAIGDKSYHATNADPDRIKKIGIGRQECTSDLIVFRFATNSGRTQTLEEIVRYDEVGVNKDDLVKSAAYKEIVKFAESIELHAD